MTTFCFKRGKISTQSFNLNLKDSICCVGNVKFSNINLDNIGIKVKTSLNNINTNLSNLTIDDKTLNNINIVLEYDGTISEGERNYEYDINWIVICDNDKFTKTHKLIINLNDFCESTDFKTTPEIIGTEIIEGDNGNFDFRFYFNKVLNAKYYKISYCKDIDFTDCELTEDILYQDNLYLELNFNLLEECTDYKIKIIALDENKTYISESDQEIILKTPSKTCECGDGTNLSLIIPEEPILDTNFNELENGFNITLQLIQSNSNISEYHLQIKKDNLDWENYENNPVLENDLLTGIPYLLNDNTKYSFRLVTECLEIEGCAKRIWGNIIEITTPNIESNDDNNGNGDDINNTNCCSVDEDSIQFQTITTNSIEVSWDNIENVDSYKLRWRIKNSNLEWNEVKISKSDGNRTSYIVNNLFPDTLYEFQIKVRCKIKI